MPSAIRAAFEESRRKVSTVVSYDRQNRSAEYLHNGLSAKLAWMERLYESPQVHSPIKPTLQEIHDLRETVAVLDREYRHEVLDLATYYLFDERDVSDVLFTVHDPFLFGRGRLIKVLAWENDSRDVVSNLYVLNSMSACDIFRRIEWLMSWKDRTAEAIASVPEGYSLSTLDDAVRYGWQTFYEWLHNKRPTTPIIIDTALGNYVKEFVEPTIDVKFSSPTSESFTLSERDIHGHNYFRKIVSFDNATYPPLRFSDCAVQQGVFLKGVDQVGTGTDPEDVMITLTNQIAGKKLVVAGVEQQIAGGEVVLRRKHLNTRQKLFLKTITP